MMRREYDIRLAAIQREGYAVQRIEWHGLVEYTAWPRTPGAAVLTAVAQSFNEPAAIVELQRKVTDSAARLRRAG